MAIKERPILFNGEMVRAILDGRKTQTRRQMKKQPSCLRAEEMSTNPAAGYMVHYSSPSISGSSGVFGDKAKALVHGASKIEKSPFGRIGDRLWVRETWAEEQQGTVRHKASFPGLGPPQYSGVWRPSIHMPRWACRITLEVKRVWVERVQDITYESACSEGIRHATMEYGIRAGAPEGSMRGGFSNLWQSIYGNWLDNPWVWCCEFEVLR
jgi:hypothetical protein